jgi:hypothetical protein
MIIIGNQYFRTLFFIAAIFPAVVWAQTQQPGESVKRYFAEATNGSHPQIPKEFLLEENAYAVLKASIPFLADSSVVLRAKAYAIVSLAGSNASRHDVRALAVTQLIEGAKDSDGGNARLALGYLTNFRKEDFTTVAKDSIRSAFSRKASRVGEVLKLAGFLELTDLKEAIRAYTKIGNSQPLRWAAVVSLARMNDNEASAEMMRRVRKLPVSDDVIYEVFPDLVYSRHPEAIAYMVEVLKSDEENCLTADAEREVPIPCGYRIMEHLAPVIDDFPLELDASGDIKTKDYVAALKKVRDWFEKNTNYKILRDKY